MNTIQLTLSTIGIGCILAIGSSNKDIDVNQMEITNTAEDMIEWMYEDIHNGNIDSNLAHIYIDNLNEIVDRNSQ